MSKCDDCYLLDVPQWICSVTGRPVTPGDDACNGFRPKTRKQFINVPPKQKRESELKGIDDAGVV